MELRRLKAFFFSLFFMDKKKVLNIIGTIILFIGFFFAFLPHAFHDAVLGEAKDEESHVKHSIYGMSMVIIGLVILVYANDALRKFGKSKKK